MRILLDENMPNGLLAPLRALGHTVESVGTLRLKGLDNSRLYGEVAQAYDLFFTKDRDFVGRLRVPGARSSVRVVLTSIRQRPEPEFVSLFMEAFVRTDWARIESGGEWPP